MKSPPAVLTNAFYAFYDLHRPAYAAFAAARLPAEEAQIAVSYLFSLVADNWTTVVTERHPSAWAWERHTQVIARRSGRTTTVVEDVSLLHHQLLLSVSQIASVTGTEEATVAALLAAADREAGDRTGRVGLWASMIKPVTSSEARWRHAFRLRTAAV
ncbi:hypothetical protein [Streptomyces sp. or20]|uniref:hypothetical protein n=1 Tax=Streptomyces sp. or20 TaxID=1828016 RepID=UPI000BF18997|nr:hypothetical protein [Streptomyces sp. or20]